MMEIVSDYLAGLGFDVIKDSAEKKLDEAKLKTKLKTYIEGQRKYNEVCSLAEECDFQGLIEYISDNLMETVKTRFRSTKSRERGRARQEIVAAAVSYSSADTEEAKRRVGRLIENSLDIVSNFFKEKIHMEDYYLAEEVVEAVKENTDETAEKMAGKVIQAVASTSGETKRSVDELSQRVGTLEKTIATGSLFSLDQAAALLQDGQYSRIESGINKLLDHISVEHPLFPKYGYGFENNRLKSVPLMEGATKLYPPRYRFTGTICAGEHYFNDSNINPLDYAYRHQVSLVLSVKEAIKLLGDIPDPIQSDVERLSGKKVMITPPAFPDAFPCSIKLGDTVFYNYVLLRTQEILDDGTYIISNKEQTESKIYFEIRWKFKNPISVVENDGIADESIEDARIVISESSAMGVMQESLKPVDFKIQIRNDNYREMLNYKKFILGILQHDDLHVYSLEYQKDIFAGAINNFEAETGFASIEEEVDFLERICAIEEHFNVHLDLPEEISGREYQCIIQISDLLLKEQVEFTWNETEFNSVVSDHFKEALIKLETPISMLTYVGITDVNIFGAEFSFKFKRTYREAVMQDIGRIRRLVEQLEEGDPLRIKFKPGEDNTGFDTINIPDKLLEADEKARDSVAAG